MGDNAKVRSEAGQLAATIWANERIRALAENPLMLTTLLVVRRCIGELPNRRGRTVPRGRARADSHMEHGGLRAHGPGGNGGAARWVDANQDRRNRVVNASEVILLEEGGPTFA